MAHDPNAVDAESSAADDATVFVKRAPDDATVLVDRESDDATVFVKRDSDDATVFVKRDTDDATVFVKRPPTAARATAPAEAAAPAAPAAPAQFRAAQASAEATAEFMQAHQDAQMPVVWQQAAEIDHSAQLGTAPAAGMRTVQEVPAQRPVGVPALNRLAVIGIQAALVILTAVAAWWIIGEVF